MSKSLKRVEAALAAAGTETEIREVGQARTAQEAADAAGVSVDQIVKSIIVRGEESGHVVLFLTAGGNRVSAAKAPFAWLNAPSSQCWPEPRRVMVMASRAGMAMPEALQLMRTEGLWRCCPIG